VRDVTGVELVINALNLTSKILNGTFKSQEKKYNIKNSVRKTD